MENASKALIIAASVLLGLMIISVGVALFNSFSSFGQDAIEQMTEKKISEFNNTYLKYYGTVNYTNEKTGKEESRPIQVTAHDIVSVANSARENNINYELQKNSRYNENNYYIQVQVNKILNFEKQNEKEYADFLRNNSLTTSNETKYYICTDVKISSTTKRVMYVKFEEYKI